MYKTFRWATGSSPARLSAANGAAGAGPAPWRNAIRLHSGTSWWGGALSERLNLYAYQCYHLPDAISDEVGALVEPFSATVRAVTTGQIGPEDNVAIVGAGPIGLMALMAANLRGAKRVVAVEVAQRRKDTAKKLGATDVIDPATEDAEKRALALTEGEGFDVVMECAGQPMTAQL